MDCLHLAFIRVEETVSRTQRFLTRKIWPKTRSVSMTNKFESKCLQFVGKRMLQEDDVLPRATAPPFLSALHAKNDTTNLFDYKLCQSTENNKAPLFFSGKETIQSINSSI